MATPTTGNANQSADGAGRWLLAAGALLGFLAVVGGTFGAHGLEGNVSAERLETFELGVRYQMLHALALLATGLIVPRGGRVAVVAGALMVVGVVVFSGSLYALVLSGAGWWGAVTPVGGVSLLAGWATLLIAILRRTTDEHR